MGLEHLIAALGATWFMSSQEKKAQRQQEAAANAAYLAEVDRQIAAKQYLARQNFNRKRQHELDQMARSIIQEDRTELAQILGRPYCNTDVAIERAIKAIADKEGWRYYDENLLIYDAEYCRLSGMVPLAKEVVDAHDNREKKRKRDEVRWKGWVERNPNCFEVNVSPEYYKNEDDFALGIKAAYSKWRSTIFDCYGLDVSKYETKAAYKQAVEDRKKELMDYQEALDILGIATDFERNTFCVRIDILKEDIKVKDPEIPMDLFLYIEYLNRCVPHSGASLGSWERDYLQILRVQARLHGLDFDEVLENAEKGTLLPKGAKVFQNNYLGWYILSGTGKPYTWFPSSHYYKNYGFTLDDFSKTCGKNPGFYFLPPIKGIPPAPSSK